MKKSGFTMIELIFVIVILGILAAVAVPKLNATRADAEAAKGASNVSTLIGDTYSYYTAQGEFADTLTNMQAITNVVLNKNNLQVNGKDCLAVARVDAHSLSFTKSTGNTICDKVLGLESIVSLLTGNVDCTKATDDDAGGKTHSTAQTAAGCTDEKPIVKNITEYPTITINYQGNGVKW